MIIECINCFKKFNVDPSLIPDSGREIRCGSCNHTWFYIKNITTTDTKTDKFEILGEKRVSKNYNKQKTDQKENNLKSLDKKKTEGFKSNTKKSENSNFTLSYLISIFFVIIISFIALIIVLDTFKLPLINLFPNLELILFNLFETLKDIFLFIKNLIL